jgi:hypothetical protein
MSSFEKEQESGGRWCIVSMWCTEPFGTASGLVLESPTRSALCVRGHKRAFKEESMPAKMYNIVQSSSIP